jgi:lipopolysaccharide export system ATP-binding protein
MTAPEWISSLGDRDPSVAIALAAITKAAGPGDVCAFADLVMTYREAHLACYNAIGVLQEPEISGDEVRDHLRRSVLPRLAVEGWLIDTSATDWDPVTPRVAWWGAGGDERRELIYQSLLAAAQRAAQRSARQAQQPAAPKRTRASVLEGLHLVKSFKDRRVVNEVSVKVEQGEIVGLLGPNGAGKTTSFYMIVGLIRPDRGKVFIGQRELTGVPMYKRARAGIGYLAQEPSIFRRLTVEENVMAILQMMKLTRAERKRRLEELLDELGIKHLRKTKAYALSGGERRRLEITRALVSQPRFMLLDEPFAGVDPIAVHDIQQIVSDLRRRGIGVLISDHNVEQTLDIVDRAYIMYEGRVRVSGTVSELVWNDEVAEIYLGPTLTARMRERYDHPESEDAA